MTTEERLAELFTEARKTVEQKPHPRFSNAAGCIREHVYAELAVRNDTWARTDDRPVRWNAAAACGHAIGAMLESAAERLGGATQATAELADENGEVAVRGSADIVWSDAVWDLKCVGDYAWYKARKAPDPKHVTQVSSYAAALGKPKWVLVYIYLGSIGKGPSLKYCFHEGATDPAIAAGVVEHWKQVAAFADRGELPDRPFEGPGSFECSVCRHSEECWKEKQ